MKKEGYFGNFGGRFVPEALRPPLMELEEAMDSIMPSREYRDALQDLLVNYAGRETPLTFCPHLSEKLGFRLWLKREDLLHTGAHKINNALGQALLAKMMGKTHLIAETGAGQHGVATATAAARLKMDCTIFMGAEDVERQSMNVMRMKLLGATVFPIESGSRTLKDAINEALRYWISHQADTIYTLPECTATADNYYVHEGLYFGQWDPDAIGEKYAAAWENGQKKVSVKFATPELYEQAVQFFIHDEKISNYCDGITTMYYIENKEQKILCISF